MNNRKGLTKYNNKTLMKQSETLKKKYKNDKNLKCGFKKGIKHSEEHKIKISKARKGMKFSKKHIEKMRVALTGRKLSNETKRKLSLAHKGLLKNIPKSLEHRRKISESKKGNCIFSEESKKKMRISAFNYVKKRCNILYPCIGHNEEKILDNLEKELDCKIIRQYKCEGYFIDGYIEEINVAIEVDERPKINDKDIEREKIIKNKLNCKFIRIKDYD